MQTHLWWMSGVDICKIVSKFLQAMDPCHPVFHPWNHTPESRRLHKAENTDNLFDYQCFRWRRFILLVELEGTDFCCFITLIFLMFQNTVLQLVSDFDTAKVQLFFHIQTVYPQLYLKLFFKSFHRTLRDIGQFCNFPIRVSLP